MSYLEKNNAYKALKTRIKHTYGTGLIKLSNETLEHFTVKCQVAWFYYKSGWEIHSECEFDNHERADLVVLHRNGTGLAIEILKSEKDKDCDKKTYPFPIRKVYVKDFDITKFAI